MKGFGGAEFEKSALEWFLLGSPRLGRLFPAHSGEFIQGNTAPPEFTLLNWLRFLNPDVHHDFVVSF